MRCKSRTDDRKQHCTSASYVKPAVASAKLCPSMPYVHTATGKFKYRGTALHTGTGKVRHRVAASYSAWLLVKACEGVSRNSERQTVPA